MTSVRARSDETPMAPKVPGAEHVGVALPLVSGPVALFLALDQGTSFGAGCCDDSPNHHATRHYHATKHPVIKSFEPGEDWAWCHVDEEMLERIEAFVEESPQQHYDPPGARP